MSEEPTPMIINPDDPGGYVQEATSATPAAGSSRVPEAAWLAACGAWIDGHVRNSPVAGATEAWNHLMGQLPRLREYLETELSK